MQALIHQDDVQVSVQFTRWNRKLCRILQPQQSHWPLKSPSDSESKNAAPLQTPSTGPLVMQIVVRRDLFDKEKWGVGTLMAQAAHAATSVSVSLTCPRLSTAVDAFRRQVLHETRERQETIDYLADLRTMRKTPDVSTLERLSAALSNADPAPIPHHLWIEQPENIPTCIALAPNRKEKSIRKAVGQIVVPTLAKRLTIL
ncbi:hypothetical protein J3R83DRAFT_2560 [Lanmaoa asiatica]|nr:hypothetical protein J3R83DRAFT_2560 [Lanmaoa asiatica]